ncbi:MAG: hypothetical protein AB1414_17790 [bacterium]
MEISSTGRESKRIEDKKTFSLEPNYGHGYRTRFTNFQCFIRVHVWLNSYLIETLIVPSTEGGYSSPQSLKRYNFSYED